MTPASDGTVATGPKLFTNVALQQLSIAVARQYIPELNRFRGVDAAQIILYQR
jgi:hypothetical protein